MSSPFPEIPGLTFQPAVPLQALETARRCHSENPGGTLPAQMSRLVWAYFNASAGRQGPEDLGALQTERGQRLLYESNAQAWLAEIPDIAREDLRLAFDPNNITDDWFELRRWFENRKDSDVAAPLVQLVAHIETQGAAPSLRPVDVRYPFEHIVLRLRIGRCLIVRDTGKMADWLEACHAHGATALGVVQGPGEGPSSPADEFLEIKGSTRYNSCSRLSVLDFGCADNVVLAWSAFTGRPSRHLVWI